MPRHTLYRQPDCQREQWPPLSLGAKPLSDEKPRDVYRDACAKIAEALGPLGFRYFRSRQECCQKHGSVLNTIRFQSSHFNIAGLHVQLWMHATVSSDELRDWRQRHLNDPLATGHIAGGMVHRLGTEYALVEWELANPADRADTIEDAIAFIREVVLPYFAQFESPERLIKALTKSPIPALDLGPSVEFALCFGGTRQAQSVLNLFVQSRPDLAGAIDAAMANPTATPGSYAEQVAYLRKKYQLQ